MTYRLRWLLFSGLVMAVALLLSRLESNAQRAEVPTPPLLSSENERLLVQSLGMTRLREPPVLVSKLETLETELGDFDQIRERGRVRILVEGSEEAFLPRVGMPADESRRLAQEFARRHGLRSEFVLVDDKRRLIPMLLEGKGDIIAAELTVTPARREQVLFTWPIATVQEVLVGRMGASDLPKSPEDLSCRTVHVLEGSSLLETLDTLALDVAPGLEIETVPAYMDTEEIAYEVSMGLRPLTVVNSRLLEEILTYNDQVQPLFPIAENRQIAWAVRKENPELRAALDSFLIENALMPHAEERLTGDLEDIQARGVLRVLTRNNSISYFLHRGQQFGLDFELASMMAEAMGVQLEMVVPPSRDLLIPWLLEGRGDLIAAGLAITSERSKQVRFSRPYLYSEPILVQKAGRGALPGLEALRGKSIHLAASSNCYEILRNLHEDFGPFDLVLEPEDIEAEELIDRVASGEIEYTAASRHVLQVEILHGQEVEAGIDLTRPGSPPNASTAPTEWGAAEPPQENTSLGIAFALRTEDTKLLEFVNDFVRREYRGLRYNMASKRYLSNERRIRQVKAGRAGLTGQISPFDDIIKKYSKPYGLDWRLMAALAYEESHFNLRAQSLWGAVGLFQLLPATGRAMGFEDLEDLEQSTHAGIKFMNRLLHMLEPSIPFQQRVLMALGAYNAGIGHVNDARRIAELEGLDPNLWFGNVEEAMLLLRYRKYYSQSRYGYCRCSEPVEYVAEVQRRYDSYVRLFPEGVGASPL